MKSSKLVLVFASAILMISLLASCAVPAPVATSSPEPLQTVASTVEPTAAPVIVTDALGRTVEFATLPQKIVLVGKATTLLANSVFLFPEASERVISYENRLQNSNNFIKTAFPKTEGLTLLDKDAGPEQIAPLNPDLVIMKTYMQEKLGTPVEALGIKVVYLDLETPEKFFQDIRTIGQIFGNSVRAEEIVSLYEANDARIADALTGLSDTEKPSVLMLQYSNKGGEVAFSVPPVEWLQTILVEKAGGSPLWKDTVTNGGWTMVTLEQIAAWNPDMIFVVDYSGKAMDVVSGLKLDSKWQALNAVMNSKIFAFPLDFLSWDQPDSRWSLGELWLATKIHPDRFTSIKMLDEVTTFYKTYYGLEDSVIVEKIIPLVVGDL